MLIRKPTATLLPFLFFIILNAQDDLILQNQGVTMYGEHTYNNVFLYNSHIDVDPYTGYNDERGFLQIYADSIIIDASSYIDASGAGGLYDNSYPGDGGSIGFGGGGYGGLGGDGGENQGSGGASYGDNLILNLGSRGASLNDASFYGSGGGAVLLQADYIRIDGEINARGKAGESGINNGENSGGKGGGSGGHIIIIAQFMDINGWLNADGGNGGSAGTYNNSSINPDGGGGGGGGRIYLNYTAGQVNLSRIYYAGGVGGPGNLNFGGVNGFYGQDGVIEIVFDESGNNWISSSTHPDESLYYLVNQPEIQLANEGGIDGFFYEISNSPALNVDIQSYYIASDGDTTLFILNPLSDGIWYFNAIPFSSEGILLNAQGLSFQLNIATEETIIITSSSHADSDTWYENLSVVINVNQPDGINTFHYDFDQSPFTVPIIGESTPTINSTWVIPSLEDGVYFLHIIPEDSAGNVLEMPIRKRFNVGPHPPFIDFTQNSGMVDTLILSSTTLDDSLTLQWASSGHTTGDTFNYFINYYFELENIFPDTSISNQDTYISYSAIDVYRSMLNVGADIVHGYWWVNVADADDTLNSSNGPSELTIITDQTLTSYTPFSLIGPTNDTTLTITQNSLTDTISFIWEPCFSVFNDSMYFNIDFGGILNFLFNDSLLADTVINYSVLDIYFLMDSLGVESGSGDWQVTASNGPDYIESLNGPFEFSIEIDSAGIIPLASFSLIGPGDSSEIIINHEIINDTLIFNWTESYSLVSDSTTYRLSFIDSSGFLNNDSSYSLFTDAMLVNSSFSTDFTSLYHGMDSLELDSIDFMWQVEVLDSVNTLPSFNGPFYLKLKRLTPPLVPFSLALPQDNYQINLGVENIFDTLSFIWSESYNFLSESTSYSLLFTDSLGYVNNESETSLFNNIELSDNQISFTNLNLYRKMDSLSLTSASIDWQVNIHDSLNTRASDNGPFNFTIEREIINFEVPILSFELESQLMSHESNLLINATYIYDDTMNVTIDYSIDGGSTWTNEFSVDTLVNLLSIDYNWDLLEEFGWGYLDQVMIRAYATVDSISGDTVVIDGVTITNIVGDYIYSPETEIGIQANDIAELISVFYQEGNNISSYDIGPSSGNAPELILQPDGMIDFEDLATFTQMWYWSASNLTALNSSRFADGNFNGNNHFSIHSLVEKIEDDQKIIPFSIDYSDDIQVMGLDIVLKYDPKQLCIESISKGNSWNSNANSALVFDKHISTVGTYFISAWSQNATPLSLNGNLLNLKLSLKNSFRDINQIEIFIKPYYTKNSKGEISQYILDIDLRDLLPKEIFLSSNYPNPFNPTTNIDFGLNELGHVRIMIYDILGREVKTLINSIQDPGYKSIQWNATNNQGQPVSAGLYLYTIQAGGFRETKKMVLLK